VWNSVLSVTVQRCCVERCTECDCTEMLCGAVYWTPLP